MLNTRQHLGGATIRVPQERIPAGVFADPSSVSASLEIFDTNGTMGMDQLLMYFTGLDGKSHYTVTSIAGKDDDWNSALYIIKDGEKKIGIYHLERQGDEFVPVAKQGRAVSKRAKVVDNASKISVDGVKLKDGAFVELPHFNVGHATTYSGMNVSVLNRQGQTLFEQRSDGMDIQSMPNAQVAFSVSNGAGKVVDTKYFQHDGAVLIAEPLSFLSLAVSMPKPQKQPNGLGNIFHDVGEKLKKFLPSARAKA